MIATQTHVDVKGIDKKLLEKISDAKYFAREKSDKKTGEDAFFKQGEKPEVRFRSPHTSQISEANVRIEEAARKWSCR